MVFRPFLFLKQTLLSVSLVLLLSGCADFRMGKAAYQTGNYSEAAWHYRKLAEFGLSEAQVIYAQILLKGQGVKANPVLARHYLEEAADAHYGRAYAPLAKIYLSGTGGPVHPGRARYLLEHAEQGDEARNSLDLAKLYYSGIGGPKNTGKAKQIYLESFNQGNKDTAYMLGRIAQDEGHVNEAKKYYLKAFDAGNAKAAKQIAVLHEKDMKPPQLVTALKWYKIARKNGEKDLDKKISNTERKIAKAARPPRMHKEKKAKPEAAEEKAAMPENTETETDDTENDNNE